MRQNTLRADRTPSTCVRCDYSSNHCNNECPPLGSERLEDRLTPRHSHARYLQPGPWPVLSKDCTTGRPAAGRCPKELPGGAHACPSETSGHFLGRSRPFLGRSFKFPHVWTPAAHTLRFRGGTRVGQLYSLCTTAVGPWQRTRPCPRPASQDTAAWTRPGGSTQTGGQRGPHPPLR